MRLLRRSPLLLLLLLRRGTVIIVIVINTEKSSPLELKVQSAIVRRQCVYGAELVQKDTLVWDEFKIIQAVR